MREEPQAAPRRADARARGGAADERTLRRMANGLQQDRRPGRLRARRCRRRWRCRRWRSAGCCKTFDDVPGVDRPITVARTGFKLSGGDPDVAAPPPALGAAHRRGAARRSATAPPRSRALREAGRDMSAKRRERRRARWTKRERLVVDRDHRHRARQDRDPRLSDPGADRQARAFPQMIWLMLRGEVPDAGAGAAARGRAGRRGRPRPARAVDRDRAHGRHLRPAAQRRDGVGDQRARRRPRRRRPAVHGAARTRSTPTPASATRPTTRVAAVLERYRRRARQDHSRLRPSLARRRSARGARCSQLVRRGRAGAASSRGRFARIAQGSRARCCRRRSGRPIPMNIDGATAVIYSELGFAPALGRGIFILSRSVGILAHAWEQTAAGRPHQGTDVARHSLPLHGGPAHHAVRSIPSEADPMKQLISHQLVKYLEDRGVEYLFGLCGHTNIAVLAALQGLDDQVRQHPPRADRGAHRRRLCARQAARPRSCCRTSARA